MKKRILSFALAAFMVVSVLSLLGIGSFAAESTGLKITVGNSYAQAGTTAYVDVFVSADSFAGNYNHLRSWQIRFTSSNPDVKISATQDKLYTSDGNYMSPNSNVSLTSAFISAGSGKNIGTNEQILAKGGMKIGSIAFEIPADATGVITIGVTDQYFDNKSGLPISTLQFEKVPGTSKNLFEEATWESGTITILDEEVGGVAPAKAGSGEDFTVGDGLRVGSMTKGQKMTGTFGTLTIPATVTSIVKTSLSSASADAVVLKNTNLDKTSCGAAVEITPKLYYYQLANGLDTTRANIKDYILNDSENEPVVLNGLQASATAKVNGSAVTVLGYIAPNDLAFSDVTVEGRQAQVLHHYRSVHHSDRCCYHLFCCECCYRRRADRRYLPDWFDREGCTCRHIPSEGYSVCNCSGHLRRQ